MFPVPSVGSIERTVLRKSAAKVDIHEIRNKDKRHLVYQDRNEARSKLKMEQKRKRKQESAIALEQGIELPKKVPKTLENTRKVDETMVKENDEEVAGEEAMDEFTDFYANEKTPKVLITTSNKARGNSMDLIKELLGIIPHSFYYSRKGFPISKICEQAIEKDYTDIMIFHEDKNELNSLLMVHLPNGPTAHFRLSSLIPAEQIKNHAVPSNHKPELILNHFDTRLGHRIGRMFGSVFDAKPNFHGRRVVTLHNQRDFIFFRHHRYVFSDTETAKLQECGPRFTLKLKSLQNGLPNSQHGEFEYIQKKELGNSKRDFFI